MLLKSSKRISVIALGISLFSMSALGMGPGKASKVDSLLQAVRENSGKLFFATGVATAAFLGYKYWSPLKRSLSACVNAFFRPHSYTLSSSEVVFVVGSSTIINGSVADLQHTQEQEHQISLEFHNKITVDNINGNIEIESHDLPYVKAKIIKKAATQQDLNNIHVTLSQDQSTIKFKTWHNHAMRALVHYKLQVPKNHQYFLNQDLKTKNGKISSQNTRDSVNAETNNGEIMLRRIGGAATAKSLNGSVTLENIGGDATAHSSNGAIQVKNVRGANTVCNTNNGAITVENVVDLHAKTNSGAIDVKQVRNAELKAGGTITAKDIFATDYFNAQTTNGTIEIKNQIFHFPCTLATTNGCLSIAAQSLDVMARIKTTNGRVKSDFTLSNVVGHRSNQRNDFTATIGNDDSPFSLDLSATNGSITLKRLN